MVTAPLSWISLQASDIFFLYQVWLFTRPKFNRKFIQRADVLHSVCFPACLPEICAKCVEGQWRNFFPGLLCMHNFFSLNYPCMNQWFFLYFACPLPHNFSNGPSLKNVHILSCAWTVPIFRAVSTLKFSYGIFININNDNLITFKLHIDKVRHYIHQSSCWFKVEPPGFSCDTFISFLIGLFIPTGNSFKSLGKAFVILAVSKPERTFNLFKVANIWRR